jgi:Protein of unknown function (DUF3131)
MMQILVNYGKTRSFLGVRFVSLHVSLDAEGKKGFFKYNRWRFSKKVKGLMVFAIIAVLLVSVFAWLSIGTQNNPSTVQLVSNSTIAAPSPTGQQTATPTQTKTPTGISDLNRIINQAVTDIFVQPRPPGLIESSQNANSTMWKEVAAIAWRYFQPGVGVDPGTGLPRAGGTDSPNFTDWDLGVYIQAVMDANATEVIGNDGAWGSSARLETVVSFLETRELNSYNYPYWFYQARDGKSYRANSDLATSPVDGIDTGRLFVALNNLKAFNYSLAQRIDTIVKGPGNRSNYAALVPNIKQESLTSNSIYFYYVASGFAGFWPKELSNATNTILNNIISAGNVTTPEGVSLPIAAILGDPLLCSVFELNINNPKLMAITHQVYLAHEAYYNNTGHYRAFSEGASLSDHWAYEWVVLPDNRTWVILDEKNSDFNISPIIYTKIAIGFLAIYNTTYAHDMVVYLERTLPDPSKGYCEGVDESGAQLSGVGIHANGLIIGAAKYAIQNNS